MWSVAIPTGNSPQGLMLRLVLSCLDTEELKLKDWFCHIIIIIIIINCKVYAVDKFFNTFCDWCRMYVLR